MRFSARAFSIMRAITSRNGTPFEPGKASKVCRVVQQKVVPMALGDASPTFCEHFEFDT